MDHPYIMLAKVLGLGVGGFKKWHSFLTCSTVFMLTYWVWWVRKSTKMWWRNVWMTPRVSKSSPMACGAEPNCFRAVSCFTLEPSFFSFLPHLDTNFRSRSPLGPFSNFHVIALLTFEAKTISLLVWYAQTSTSTTMTFNYCISIRFVYFSFYLSPYLRIIGPNT